MKRSIFPLFFHWRSWRVKVKIIQRMIREDRAIQFTDEMYNFLQTNKANIQKHID